MRVGLGWGKVGSKRSIRERLRAISGVYIYTKPTWMERRRRREEKMKTYHETWKLTRD
jgi:hypothetical protein